LRLENVIEGQLKILLQSSFIKEEDYREAILRHNPKRFRKHREYGINFLNSPKTRVIRGCNVETLLTQDVASIEQLELPRSENGEITIDLGQIRLINYIELHLYDLTEEDSFAHHSYAYVVETSIDKDNNYFRVIDHSQNICCSKQRIFFYPREVRYIKIIGIASYVNLHLNQDNHYLYLRSFSCQLIHRRFDISRGLWAPEERVTDVDFGCRLVSGNNIPEGDTHWMLKPDCPEINYSYHGIIRKKNKKYLMVQLPQPVFINRLSINLIGDGYKYQIKGFLRDPDDSSTLDLDESYNFDTFEPTPVHFIKIKGYSNDEDKFKCSDFRCP